MRRTHLWGAALALLTAIGVWGPHARAADVLQFVPDNALGVIVINHVSQTETRIQQLAAKLQLPPLDMLAQAKERLGGGKGIDDTGCLALAVIPANDGGEPVVAVYIPVNNYQAFVEQQGAEPPVDGISNIVAAGDPSAAVECDGYAVIVERANSSALKSVRSPTLSLAATTPSLTKWRTDKQAYGIATPTGVKLAQQQILAGLTTLKAQLAQQGPQGQQALLGLQLYENLFKSLDKEITYCATGLRIEESGDIHIVGRTLLADGGVLAGLAAGTQPGQSDCLAGMPQLPFVFAGGAALSPDVLAPMVDASFSMMKMYPGGENMTEDQFRKIVEVSLRSMQGMRSMGMMLGVGEGSEPLYSRMYLVIKVDDADKYIQNYTGIAREIAELFKDAEFPFSYEVEPMQIQDRQGVQLAMEMKGMFGQQEIPGGEKVMEMMFGSGDTMNIYMAAADKNTVLGSYVSKENLVSVLTSFDQGAADLTAEPNVANTVGKLDQNAQFIGLWSPQGTLAFAKRLASAIAPPVAASIPELGETSPLGFSVTLSPDGLDTHTVVPVDVTTSIADLVRQIMAMRQGVTGNTP